MVSLATPAGVMAPPPTLLPKRPTVGLKRDSSYLDTDDEASLSSTTKKLKVAFSPNVDVRFVDDWSEKSFELVKEEVRLGMERHLAPGEQKDDTQYIKLLQLLSQDAESGEAPSGKLLKKYVLAIEAKVSSLGDCGKLANAVLDLSWLGRDDVFVGLFIRFLVTLANAHPKYVASITQMLVANFPRLPASSGRLPGETPVSRASMFRRVHTAIDILLRRVPSAPDKLKPALRKEFPDDSTTTRSYVQYQQHLLRVTEYEPALHADILALITERLVSIDEQIQQDIEDLEDEAEDGLLQERPASKAGPTDFEDSDDSDADSVSETEESTTEDEQRLRELRLKVAKMDGTMDLLFEYYTPLVQGGLSAKINDAYQRLLSHFVSFILPRRTRHAQFLLFHFSQTLPEHASIFADTCVHLAFRSRESKLTRLHACAYLASFVARGAHLSPATVQKTFSSLCTELESLRRQYEPGCRGPDKRSYSMYYAVAQAVLYIFCFRWRDLAVGSATPESGDEDLSEDDLIAEGRDLAWLPGIRDIIQKSLQSRLNPLKVCSPAIVGEFAKITHHLRFAYVYSILESNKRVRLGNSFTFYTASGAVDIGRRGTAMDRKVGEAHLQLEAYFPFDPYHLPKSKRWVQGDYNEWKLPKGMKQDDEEEEDGYSDESDEDESGEESLPEEMDDSLGADAESISS
ncbi:hypothetical protein LTR08_006289 [Meristemomyces frigidus]|nr:hypothetical protein LTR08_006289 [Meristemomyces frigidus]